MVEVVAVQDSLGDVLDVPLGQLPSEAVIDLGARTDDRASGESEATTRYRGDLIRSDSERDGNTLHLRARSPNARVRPVRGCSLTDASMLGAAYVLDLGKEFVPIVLECRPGLQFWRCGFWSSM